MLRTSISIPASKADFIRLLCSELRNIKKQTWSNIHIDSRCLEIKGQRIDAFGFFYVRLCGSSSHLFCHYNFPCLSVGRSNVSYVFYRALLVEPPLRGTPVCA